MSDNWAKSGVVVPAQDAQPFEVDTGPMKRLQLDRLTDAVDAASARLLAAERGWQNAFAIQADIIGPNKLRVQIERGDFLTWGADEPAD